MSRCPACKEAGTKPRAFEGAFEIVYNPAIGVPGPPTLQGHRMSAEMLASCVWDLGISEVLSDYYPFLSRDELVLCCWWAGKYGPPKWRRRWGKWAESAHMHLWYRCATVNDPPKEAGE